MRIHAVRQKSLSSALLVLAGLLLASCVTTLGDPMPAEGTFLEQSYRPRPLDIAAMHEAGAREAVFVLAAGGQAELPGAERYVKGVLDRILQASPQPDYPVRLYLTPSISQEAKSFPNGTILVSVGLLDSVKNEDELAFVLAHELAHVLLEHHDSDWYLHAQKRAIAAAELSAGAMQNLRKRIGDGPDLDWRLAALTYATEMVTRDVLFPVFNRRQEDEADLLSVDLMARAGYNVQAAVGALEIYRDAEQQFGTDQEVARNRLERALELSDVERLRMARAKEITENEALSRPAGVLLEAVHHGVDELFAFARQTHRPAEERMDRISQYNLRVDDLPDFSDQALRATVSASSFKRTLQNFHAADAAGKALIEDRLSDAERLARQAISAPTNNHASTRIVMAEVRQAQGRHDLWEQNLRIAIRASAPSLSAYQMLADGLVVQGRTEEADALLGEAWERFHKPGHLLPSRIRVALASGDKMRVQDLLMTCRIEYAELTEECEEVLEKEAI